MTHNVAREKRTCERTNLLLLEICLSEHGVFPDDGRRSRSERLSPIEGEARATMRNAHERSTKCGANVAHRVHKPRRAALHAFLSNECGMERAQLILNRASTSPIN